MSPSDEKARLAALRRYAVLDTPPSEPFDRITRLAAELFDAPIALLTLVDEDRQWFKSRVGFEEEETDLDMSFCTHTIEDEGALVVEDATEDARFADNPLVTGAPGMRFYAGAPLTTPDGYRIGTVCVIDTEPRPLDDPSKQATLHDLAQMAMDQMELHVAGPHHATILESITDAFFALDTEWRFTYVNQQAENVLDRSRDELLGRVVWDEFPEAVDLAFYEQYHRAVREEQSVQFEAYFPPLETWFRVNAYPFKGGLSVYFDDVTERREAEQELAQSVQRNRQILQTTIDGYLMYDASGTIVDVNPAYCEMVGRSREELIGTNLTELDVQMSDEEVLDRLQRFVSDDADTVGRKRFETQHRHRDGYPIDVEVSIGVMEDADQRFLHAFVRDVTERKQAREALRTREEYLAVTLQSIGDAVIATDPEGLITAMNPIAETLTGWSLDEAAGHPLVDIFQIENAKTGAPVESPVDKVLEEGQIVGLANHTMLTARDGTQHQIADSAAPIRTDEGELLGVVMVFRDVTDRYEQEEALKEQRQRLELALIGGDLGLWDLNLDTGTNIINEQWAAMLGYTIEEVGDSQAFFEEHTHPDDLEKAYAQLERHAQGEIPYLDVEIRMRHKDGTWRWILDRGKILEWNDDGSPHRVVGTHLDITEKKKREQALRERTIALEQAQAVAQTGSGIIDLAANTIALSEEAGRLLGLDPSVTQPVSAFMELVHPDDLALVQQEFERVRAGETHDEEYRITPAGRDEVRWLRGQGRPETDDEGTVTRVFSTIADITEQKERERALRESRRLLEESQRIAHLGHWDWNVETDDIFWSDEAYRIFGYDPQSIEVTIETYFDAIPQPDRERVEALNQESVATGHMETVEHRIVRPDGSERVVEIQGMIMDANDDGTPRRVVGTMLDVTERKRREEELQRQRDLLDQAQRLAGAWENDLRDGSVSWSDEMYNIMERPRDEELHFDELGTLFPPESRPTMLAAVQRAIDNHEPWDLEIPLVTAKGNRRWVRTVGAPVVRDGEVIKLAGALQDITTRKQQEQALRESKIALEQAQAIAQTGNGIWDLETGTFTLSEEAARLLGLEAHAEYPLDALFDLVHPDDRALMSAEFEGLQAGETHDAEYRVRPAGSDTIRWLRGRGQPEHGDDGTVTRVFGTIADITERKEMEKRLRAQEQMYRELVQTTSAILWRADPDTFAFTYVSPQVEALLGYSPDEWVADPDFWGDHIHPDDRDWAPAYCRQATREQRRHNFDYRMIADDGRTVWLRDIVNVVVEDGEPKELVGVMIDVTELKEAEQALRESEERYRTLVESHPDPIHITVDGRYEYVNPSGAQLFGFDDPDEVMGRSVFEFVPDDNKERIQERKDQLERGEAVDAFEHRMVRHDGEERIVVARSIPITYKGQPAAQTVIRDVTEQRLAEQALRESEERYRTLVERSHDAIYIYRGNRLLFVNERVRELTGYSEDELLNMNVFELVHPDDREQVRQYAIQRADGTAPSRYEARLVRKNGDVRYGDFSVQAITYQGEQAAIGSIRDVTQRRHAEQALRESEQRFRALAEETTDVVTRHAPDGTYLYASPAVEDVLGYSPDELLGASYQSLIHPDDQERVAAHVARAQREGEKVQFEYRIRHAEGHYVWVETAGQHIPGDGGEATLIASTRSVAERKAAEQALVRREQRVEALYQAMRGLTEARTRKEVAEHVLTLIDDTLGYPISAVRYQTDDGTLTPVAISEASKARMPERPDYDISSDSLAAQAFRRGETTRYGDVRSQDVAYDLGVVRAVAYVPIGSYGTISVGSPDVDAIDDFDLKLIEILARNAEGVLERIDREDALRAARDEAEEMNRLKSAFLANMSHEIRTPLTSIIGFSEVLGDQDLGDASRFAELIQRGGQRLLETLNSVLDLSQLEAGSMRLSPETINVAYEVESTLALFAPRAQNEGIELDVHKPDEPVEAHLDAAALQRILSNLLSNAVKFTPSGGRIDVRLRAAPDHVVLEIEDTGVGIDEDFLPHLFDAFRQESTGNARTFEGSGLGLAITQQLVHLMGGAIDVTTAKGEGTCFTVQLPYRVPE